MTKAFRHIYLTTLLFCLSPLCHHSTTNESISWRILDLSVAMTYSMLTAYGKRNRALSAAAAFLRGFHSVCPVPENERKHLVLLMACRLSCSATLGAYSYQQNPGNEYLLLHATPAWNTLDLIWGTDLTRRKQMKATLDILFQQACQGIVDANAEVLGCSDLAFPDPNLSDPLQALRGVEIPGEREAKRPKAT